MSGWSYGLDSASGCYRILTPKGIMERGEMNRGNIRTGEVHGELWGISLVNV